MEMEAYTYTLFADYEGKIVSGYRREWGDTLRGGTEILTLAEPTTEVRGYFHATSLPHATTLETWDYEDE